MSDDTLKKEQVKLAGALIVAAGAALVFLV